MLGARPKRATRSWSALAATSLSLLTLWSTNGLALDPSLRLSQYGHTAWRSKEAYFTTAPITAAQTTDGYMWFGTPTSLIRFDGMRFETQPPVPLGKVPVGPITALHGARDGSLWIGYPGGLAELKSGNVRDLNLNGRVNAIVDDAGATKIWFVRTRSTDGKGPLCSVDAESAEPSSVRCFNAADGVTIPSADHLVRDDDGSLWFGGAEGLMHWRQSTGAEYFLDKLKAHKDFSGITGLATSGDSTWATISTGETALVLDRFENGRWTERRFDSGHPGKLSITAITVDHDGSLWIGTDSAGIYRLAGDTLDHLGSEHGLSGNRVVDFFEDADHNIWVLTTAGVDYFSELAVVTFSSREGLSSDDVGVVEAQGNTVWIGNAGYLDRIIADHGFRVETDTRIHALLITTIADGHDGRFWVGADKQMYVGTREGYQPILGSDGKPLGAVEVMAIDAQHDAWLRLLGSPNRLLRVHDGVVVESFARPTSPVGVFFAPDPKDGAWSVDHAGTIVRARPGSLSELPSPQGFNAPIHVQSIRADDDGTIWLASREGLIAQRSGVRKVMDASNGLPCTNIFALIDDAERGLWLYADCGIVGIARAELERWWQAPTSVVQMRYFDGFEGAAPAKSDFWPWATRTTDGRLWFANGAVVQMIDPARRRETRMPPVHIEQVSADRKEYPIAAPIHLPALARNVAINYTVPTFVSPRKATFRYSLDGYDTNWQEAGTRRQALYSSLAPGRYTFRVAARNEDGSWSPPDSVDIELAAAFWQTTWFRVIVLAVILALAALLHRRHLHQAAAVVQGRYEGRIAERERIARELHDTLLQSIQGLILNVYAVTKKLPADDSIRGRLENVLQDAGAALVEGRDRVHEIRSQTPDSAEIGVAFEAAAASLSEAFPASFHVSVLGNPRPLHPVVKDEAFWIAREALINAARHAQAKRVTLALSYQKRQLLLVVADDGIGLGHVDSTDSRARGHFGIVGMRERARTIGARIEISSRRPSGTEVELRIPARLAYAAVAAT